jgi:hypothetical protein
MEIIFTIWVAGTRRIRSILLSLGKVGGKAKDVLRVFPGDVFSKATLNRVRLQTLAWVLFWIVLSGSILYALIQTQPKAVKEITNSIKEVLEKRKTPTGVDPITYSIVISYLKDDDEKRTAFQNVEHSIKKHFPFIAVYGTGYTLERAESSPGVDDKKQSKLVANKELTKRNAQLLVWGKVVGNTAVLYFSTRLTQPKALMLDMQNQYAFGDEPLSVDFRKDLAMVLVPMIAQDVMAKIDNMSLPFAQYKTTYDQIIAAITSVEAYSDQSLYPLNYLKILKQTARVSFGIATSDEKLLENAATELEGIQKTFTTSEPVGVRARVAYTLGNALTVRARALGDSTLATKGVKSLEDAALILKDKGSSASVGVITTNTAQANTLLWELTGDETYANRAATGYRELKREAAERRDTGALQLGRRFLGSLALERHQYVANNKNAVAIKTEPSTYKEVSHVEEAFSEFLEIVTNWKSFNGSPYFNAATRIEIATLISELTRETGDFSIAACGLRALKNDGSLSKEALGPVLGARVALARAELHLYAARATYSEQDLVLALGSYMETETLFAKMSVPAKLLGRVEVGAAITLFQLAMLRGDQALYQQSRDYFAKFFLRKGIPQNEIDVARSVWKSHERIWNSMRSKGLAKARFDFRSQGRDGKGGVISKERVKALCNAIEKNM